MQTVMPQPNTPPPQPEQTRRKSNYKPPIRVSDPNRATAIPQVSQAYATQAVSFQMVKAIGESLKKAKSSKQRVFLARALRDAVTSWDTARDALRILRGKGLPTKVAEKQPKRKLLSGTWGKILDLEEAKLIPEETGQKVTGERSPETDAGTKESIPQDKTVGTG